MLKFFVQTDYILLANKTMENINISSTDVAAQALIFFFGGFDTTATSNRFMAYELAVNPDVQDKLRKEIIEIYENCQGNVTYENIMTMNYLDMVVSGKLKF
ncbi:hypothetical protein C4B38_000325 [Diabrotica virgifera virgifera]|uniref:Probable cytochrome P450 6a21 n=1 Tax=Diabrotica virgifera virgifera TaxID=50390 RepID=A0A6P7GTJ5_DIAVI|nr:hypothetical protein C4B38_000325 [Diabrotica virgifera virgifera]